MLMSATSSVRASPQESQALLEPCPVAQSGPIVTRASKGMQLHVIEDELERFRSRQWRGGG
jgi:hypothetical protein